MTFASPAAPEPARQRNGGCLSALAFLVLLLAGAIILWAFFLEPFKNVVEALRWEKVPCTILFSESVKVRVSQPVQRDYWQAQIRYRYIYEGLPYRSGHIWFQRDEPDAKADVDEVVARYPKGLETWCYVKPHDPRFAVLERGLKPQLLIAIVPLALALAGLGGLISLAMRRLGPAHIAAAPDVAQQLPSAGPISHTAQARSGTLVRFALLAAAWSVICYYLIQEVVSSWTGGTPDCHGLLLTAFALPVAAVGILLIAIVLYLLLKLLNPRPTLSLSRGRVPLGGSAEVSWAFTGQVSRIRRLRISLEGREEATYQRGTDLYTDREVFTSILLLDSADPATIASGKVTMHIPSGTVPSFLSPNNRLSWAVRLCGEIRRWPNVDEEIELLVQPAPSEQPAGAKAGIA